MHCTPHLCPNDALDPHLCPNDGLEASVGDFLTVGAPERCRVAARIGDNGGVEDRVVRKPCGCHVAWICWPQERFPHAHKAACHCGELCPCVAFVHASVVDCAWTSGRCVKFSVRNITIVQSYFVTFNRYHCRRCKTLQSRNS